MTNSKWQTTNGKQQMAISKWQSANGKQQTAKQQMTKHVGFEA